MDVFVWRARLDIDLYGVGTLDRTAWDTSFRPRSLAEIFVAEPGPFEQFGETVVYSLLLSTWSYFVDSWKLSFPFSRIPETGTLQQLVVSRKKKIRCEIEDFVETHLSKLRGMLRSRVLRVLCDLIKNVKSLLRGTKSDSCGPQRIYKYAAVAMYATVFKNVCTLLGESGKLLLVIG